MKKRFIIFALTCFSIVFLGFGQMCFASALNEPVQEGIERKVIDNFRGTGKYFSYKYKNPCKLAAGTLLADGMISVVKDFNYECTGANSGLSTGFIKNTYDKDLSGSIILAIKDKSGVTVATGSRSFGIAAGETVKLVIECGGDRSKDLSIYLTALSLHYY